MSAILVLLRPLLPYLITGAIAIGAGAWTAHRLDSASYNALQAKFSTYQAQTANDRANAEKAARDALQAQINARLTTEANNAKVIDKLTQERDNAATDRDFVRRLLSAAQDKPTATGHPVSTASHQSGTTNTPGTSGDQSVTELLTVAAAESRQCFQQYNALLAELQPQLGTTTSPTH